MEDSTLTLEKRLSLKDVLDNPGLLPYGFHLAEPDSTGNIKMWLRGDRFFDDIWGFFKKYERQFKDPANNICCLMRGAGAHVTVIGNGSGRNDIHSMKVKSYKGEKAGTVFIEDLPEGLRNSDGEGWIFIDDVYDRGGTRKAVLDRWPKAQFYTVYFKPGGDGFPTGYYLLIAEIWLVFPGEQPWSNFVPYKKSGGQQFTGYVD